MLQLITAYNTRSMQSAAAQLSLNCASVGPCEWPLAVMMSDLSRVNLR